MPLARGPITGAELIAMWTLLEMTKKKEIKKLQVLGDSKLAINWAQGKLEIQNVNMENILRDIKLAFPSFEWLCFHHVLRELNVKVDDLSKEALYLQRGVFGYYEYFDVVEIEAMEFRL
jgi:hypothetical protein